MTNPYNRLFFVNEERGFAFVDRSSNRGEFNVYRPVMLKTDDGGESWKFLSGPYELPVLEFTNLAFSSDPLVGYAYDDSQAYTTVDGGDSWQPILIDVPEDMIHSPETNEFGETHYSVEGISLWDDNSGYLVGSYYGQHVFAMRDGVITPQTSFSTNLNYPNMATANPGIYSPRADVFYLIDNEEPFEIRRGRIFLTENGGQTFTEMSGIGGRGIYDWTFSGDAGYVIDRDGLLLKHKIDR
ncbi:MAG: hypothetical protein WA960_18425 [Tunicatimonas sp.]